MTTTLLIQTETTPLTVSLPSIAPMTGEEFYRFCQANRDLRIDRKNLVNKKPPTSGGIFR